MAMTFNAKHKLVGAAGHVHRLVTLHTAKLPKCHPIPDAVYDCPSVAELAQQACIKYSAVHTETCSALLAQQVLCWLLSVQCERAGGQVLIQSGDPVCRAAAATALELGARCGRDS